MSDARQQLFFDFVRLVTKAPDDEKKKKKPETPSKPTTQKNILSKLAKLTVV